MTPSTARLLAGHLASAYDVKTGTIPGAPTVERYLSDMQGYFVDQTAYAVALAKGNPLLYTVAAVEPATGDGALHYGIGRILPGRIGDEYFMTKGHFHAWRPAAEYYIGLSGEGVMLLESEDGSEREMVPLLPDSAVYVPGHIAHRTVNTGTQPLVYLGIYPAEAGHDYGAIAERNFYSVIVERAGKPVCMDRADFLAELA
jgi:glucose-6-phosphate isomerase